MKRIQRRRTRGWKMPPNAVYVGRPTKWGNPFKPGDTAESRAKCLDDYRAHVQKELWSGRLDLAELRGKDLACWCRLSDPCHVDVLIELLENAYAFDWKTLRLGDFTAFQGGRVTRPVVLVSCRVHTPEGPTVAEWREFRLALTVNQRMRILDESIADLHSGCAFLHCVVLFPGMRFEAETDAMSLSASDLEFRGAWLTPEQCLVASIMGAK